ncbi:hypothetical protein [Sediminispirochaeta smaragdinae]|uniref:Uncharacterized protein n=1 Tax=Sediminispirochaeta smaragdinae (strain DSM 11293 / JCM 15392 / SEBR 4228) TaxID=573413 RepID=E1R586_SEDSS|nr:hypothetical protein [Sediminispirochaeta smaragdinae]ADK80621.1 hypothetical protein Spirs_1494 [Sediminispirochaeta smaragdinae DSM 11293]
MEDKDSFRKAVIVVVFSALIAVVGFLTEIPAVTAGGLFMTYICCSRLLFREHRFLKGACALVILVLSSAETLSGIGTLLLFIHGKAVSSPGSWTVALFLLCMVVGEIVRKSEEQRAGIAVIIASCFLLLGACASVMLKGPYIIASDASALVVGLFLVVRSGLFAYRFILDYVEKITS